MKTTLNIRDDLLVRAKALAAQESTTLTRMVEEGLSLRIRHSKATAPRKPKDLPMSRRRGGLCAGIDSASNQSLFDAAGD